MSPADAAEEMKQAAPMTVPLVPEEFRFMRQAVPALAEIPPELQPLEPTILAGPDGVSLARWQAPFRPADASDASQGRRGMCFAFASIAALEAALYRQHGVQVNLSEQYLVHMWKCSDPRGAGMDPPVDFETSSSLAGAQGNAGAVEGLSRIAVPTEADAPYTDQQPLEDLRASIPDANPPPTNSTELWRDQLQLDAFEFSDELIPRAARRGARYRVTGFHPVAASADAVQHELAAGREVVVDIPQHCVLFVGYDRVARTWLIKNSWGEMDFLTKSFDDEFWGAIQGGYAIDSVAAPSEPPQLHARWIGQWHFDHDGWRGQLTIRRFTDRRNQPGQLVSLDGEAERTKLGDYLAAGQRRDVHGWFEDAGQKMIIYIADDEQRRACGTMAGQRFELYQFGFDPDRAAGTTTWSGETFGATMSRDPFPSAPGAAIHRSNWVGPWAMSHDGHPGTLLIEGLADDGTGLRAGYLDADGVRLPVTGAGDATSAHTLRISIPFPDGDQPFDLFQHTREIGRFSGTTVWAGRRFGVLGSRHLSPGAPGIASWAPERLDVLAVGADSRARHIWYDHGWQRWEDLGLGGLPGGMAACAGVAARRLDVFAIDAAGMLQHRWFDSGWSDWESLGGSLAAGSTPAAVSWGAGRLDIVAVGSSGSIRHTWWDGNWGGWDDLGGSFEAGPAIASWGSGRLDVLAMTDHGVLNHWWYANGTWSGSEDLPAPLDPRLGVAATSWGSDRIDIVGGAEGHVLHSWYESGWGGWDDLGGDVAGGASISSWGNGRLDVAAVDRDGFLRHRRHFQGWSDWTLH